MRTIVIILGSSSDQAFLEGSGTLGVFSAVKVDWEVSIISAHRNPIDLEQYVTARVAEGTKLFIGVAGLAAALPGAIAAITNGLVPVLGVGISAGILDGLDAALAQIRMPSGRPVLFCGLDGAGLVNAAIAACQILGISNDAVRANLRGYLQTTNKIPQMTLSPK